MPNSSQRFRLKISKDLNLYYIVIISLDIYIVSTNALIVNAYCLISY